MKVELESINPYNEAMPGDGTAVSAEEMEVRVDTSSSLTPESRRPADVITVAEGERLDQKVDTRHQGREEIDLDKKERETERTQGSLASEKQPPKHSPSYIKSPNFDPEKAARGEYPSHKEGDYVVFTDPDPDTNQEVARVKRIEGGAGMAPDIIPGKNADQLTEYIEGVIIAQEATPQAIDKEFIKEMTDKINAYEVAGGMDQKRRERLVLELQSRLTLKAADYWLSTMQDYDEFAKYYSDMATPLLNHLRDEVLSQLNHGIQPPVVVHQEGIEIIKEMETADAVGPGAYFRMTGAAQAAERDRGLPGGPAGAPGFILRLAQREAGAGNPVTATHITVARRRFGIIESLFRTSGMWAFYTGPVDANTGQLRDWMVVTNHLNPSTHTLVTTPNIGEGLTPTGYMMRQNPEMFLWRNENFWNEKFSYRRNQRQRRRPLCSYFPDPDPTVPAGTPIDDPSNLRRLFNIAEEFQLLGSIGAGGRAESLRYDMETYTIPLPMFNGVLSLSEFLGDASQTGGLQDRVKKGRTFVYAGMVKQAASLMGGMLSLLNAPLVGGESMRDLKNLDTNLKNLTSIVEVFTKYPMRFQRNMGSYAVARTLESTFSYLQSNASDLRRWFHKYPRFRQDTLNAILSHHVFSGILGERRTSQVKNSLHAGDFVISSQNLTRAAGGYAWEMIKNLLEVFGIKL